MATDRGRWAERQAEELVDLGDDLQDAEKFVNEALALTPEGEDPETYLPPEYATAAGALVDDGDIADARAEWYASDAMPFRFKRLLDAKRGET